MARFAAMAVLFGLCSSAGLAAQTSVPLALQIPASGIVINAIDFTNDGTLPIIPYECISFTNVGTSAATNVAFDFSWTQADGSSENDEFDLASGVFAPGVQIQVVKGRVITVACRMTNKGWERGKPAASLHTFVMGVRRQDGTSWTLASTIPGSAVNSPGTPVTISAVTSSESSAPIECATIENTGSKSIKHLQIIFRHENTNGTVLGDDALDVRAAIPNGAVVRKSCRPYTGVLDPGLLTYARAAAQGTASPAPRIRYKNQYATLSAFVDEVDFSDGTKWQSSSP